MEAEAIRRAVAVRRALALGDGKTVTIKGSEWEDFVAASERLYPGRREWRCVFANGAVSITDLSVSAPTSAPTAGGGL